jgi:hypothetical protein
MNVDFSEKFIEDFKKNVDFTKNFPKDFKTITYYIASSTAFSKYVIPFCIYPCVSYLHYKDTTGQYGLPSPLKKILVQTNFFDDLVNLVTY